MPFQPSVAHRRAGTAALETALLAPLVVVMLFVLFFFAGAHKHKQQTLVVNRSGTWHHARVFGDTGHSNHAAVTIDPLDYPFLIVWTGDADADWYVTTHYHLLADTNPQVEHLDDEPSGGVARLETGLNRRSQLLPSLFRALLPRNYGTETWRLTTEYDSRSSNLLGRNVMREVTTEYRIDTGTWTSQVTDARFVLGTFPVVNEQHGFTNRTVNQLVNQRLVEPRIANRYYGLSVLR